MPKEETFQDLALRPLQEGEQLWKWLYNELRAAILDGRLRAGARMPSTRSLAKQCGVSRGTVLSVFEQLHSEGYTETRAGSGTFVASGLPDQAMTARKKPLNPPALPTSNASLSKRGRDMVAGVAVLPESTSLGKAFRMYEPAVDLFPVDLWARIAGRVLRRAPRSLFGQGNASGYELLRREIAAYVGASRGVRCTAEQVIVTSGAQQALDLAARILIDPGDRVWMEDPGYPGANFVFRAAAACVVPVPVDQEGLDLQAAIRTGSAKLVYVTPANQFPLGITMSLERRLDLLRWASAEGAWIIEDEYDAEYTYSGRPVPALQSLDRSGCVLYIGTFTKMLFNALRLGFIVVPERLVDAFVAAKSFMDRHGPTLDQAVLAEFLAEGHFGHHVRRMRQVYRERMFVLIEAARKDLSGLLDVQEANAGMKTIGWLRPDLPDKEAASRARALGLELGFVSAFTVRHSQPPGLVLGFAACRDGELRRGVRVLATALNGMRAKSSTA